jgi:hypothetical protein
VRFGSFGGLGISGRFGRLGRFGGGLGLGRREVAHEGSGTQDAVLVHLVLAYRSRMIYNIEQNDI